MRFLERFSINIFNTIHAGSLPRLNKRARILQLREAGSVDRVLKNGVALLDPETQAEIRAWVLSQQTLLGGFPDRGGECDLYYTLFGFFLARALDMDMVMPLMKNYIKRTAQQQDLTGIDLFCLAILHASFFPDDPETKRYVKKIRNLRSDAALLHNGYSVFLVILSLLYLRDHAGAWQALKSIENQAPGNGNMGVGAGKPCPVVAAEQILEFMRSGFSKAMPEPLISFYRGNGGFAALTDAPATDLLSTAVALFSLQFKGSDLRLIKPDCLNFIDSLYCNGGFMPNFQDKEVDVEYTFYGLLALGALNSGDGVPVPASKHRTI